MDKIRRQQIVEILKKNDSSSVSFAETKKQLLGSGYGESEIVAALYEFPYDGKPNQPKTENKIQKYYKANPKAADRDAKFLLKELERQDREKAITYGAASAAAGNIHDYHAESYYSSRFFDTQGVSYLKYIGICALVMILGIKFDKVHEAYAVVVIITAGYSLYFLKNIFKKR